MFKIKYANLLQAPLYSALSNLAECRGEPKAVHNLLRTHRKLMKAMEEAGEVHKKVVQPFSVVVEGVYVPHERPTHLVPYKVIEGKEVELQAELEKFLSIEVEIQSNLINPDEFVNYKPSLKELLSLESVLIPDYLPADQEQ